MKNIEKGDWSLIIGITLIPLFFVISVFLWALTMDARSTLQVLPIYAAYLVKLLLIFFLLSIVLTKKARTYLIQAVKQPWLITVGLFSAAFLFYLNNLEPFSPQEAESSRETWPIYMSAWALFPLVQSQWLTQRLHPYILWVVRAPIWVIVFYSILLIVIVEGANLFSMIINFAGPNLGI